jgi:hypothetical protein
MMIKLPAIINIENDTIEVSILGKIVDSTPVSNIETITMKKINKPLFFWIILISSYILITWFFDIIIDSVYFIIFSPFILLLIYSYLNNFYNNSIVIKQFGNEPIEYVILHSNKYKVKTIVSQIRIQKDLKRFEKNISAQDN